MKLGSGGVRWGRLVGWAVGLAVLSFWLSPYHYGFGNHHAYVPHLQHLLDPTLYPKDPLIESFRTIPSAFWQLVASVSAGTGGEHTLVLHASALLSRVVLVLALLHLGHATFGLPFKWTLPLTVLAVPPQVCAAAIAFGVGAHTITQTSFVLGAELFALSLLCCGRPLLAYVILAVACPFHGQSAVLLFGIFLVRSALCLGLEGPSRSLVVRHALGIAVFGAAALAMMLLTPKPEPLTVQAFEAYRNAMSFRIAHHSFPLLWGMGDWVHALAAPLIVGAACWDPDQSRKVRLLCAAVVLGFATWSVIHLVGAETTWVHSRLPIILAPMRSSKWLIPVALALSVQLGRESLQLGKAYVALWLVNALLVLAEPKIGMMSMAAYALFRLATKRYAGRWPVLSKPTTLLVPALCTLLMAVSKQALGQARSGDLWLMVTVFAFSAASFLALQYIRRPELVLATGLLLQLVVAPTGKLASSGWGPVVNLPAPLRDIGAATERHVPNDGLVLSPPDLEGFRLHARRSIVGDWKDGGYHSLDPKAAIVWAKLMGQLLADDELAFVRAPARRRQPRPNLWRKRTLEQVVGLAKSHHAGWIVLRTSSAAARTIDGKGVREVYRNSEYVLLQLSDT